MHRVVFDEPYEFIAPYRRTGWSRAIRLILPWVLKSRYNIRRFTVEGESTLREAIAGRTSLILCPNHCSDMDPMVTGLINRKLRCHTHSMASWHVFRQSRSDFFFAHRLGGFSVYREGPDRRALDTAVEIVAAAERPLVVFPEGVISRAEDRLIPLMEGPAFVGRMAARKKSKPGTSVLLVPIAIRYEPLGQAEGQLAERAVQLEQCLRLSPTPGASLADRIRNIADRHIANLESELIKEERSGNFENRAVTLANDTLLPLESEYEIAVDDPTNIVNRVKALRSAILPPLITEEPDPQEHQRRWNDLRQCYYAQCASLYVPGYISGDIRGRLTLRRLMEVLDRVEEDRNDVCRRNPSLGVHIRIGTPIALPEGRSSRREQAAVLPSLRQGMLKALDVEDWWPPGKT